MLAVIKTGGKQYLVSPGQKIKIEKVEGEKGKEIVFDQVLLLEEGKNLKIGKPYLKGVKVLGKILEQGRGEKSKKGPRQFYTSVVIEKFETESSK
jgi:large subunit ribosomal protein L21